MQAWAGNTHYSEQSLAQPTVVNSATSAPSSTDGPGVSAEEVGAAFAYQYFKIMKTRPEDLIRFYNNDSQIARGIPALNGTSEFSRATGVVRIRELLHKEHCCGTRPALAIINAIESQDSANGSVVVQIIGSLRYVDESTKNFMMSVFLIPQDRVSSSSGFYVLNDILTFQSANERCISPQVDQPILKTQPSQPQPRLTQEAPDPVTAPVAPSAQPGAAPLPTTTAPQLSGATTTPTAAATASTEVAAASLATVSSLVDSSHDSADEGTSPAIPDECKEQEDLTPMVPTIEDDHLAVIAYEKGAEATSLETPVPVDVTPNETKVESVVSNLKPDKKNPWKRPTAVTEVREGFDDIDAISESKKVVDAPKAPQQPTVADAPHKAAVTRPDASRYHPTSYAAHLLKPSSVGGNLPAPCQMGFSVPPADTGRIANRQQSNEKRERRSNDLQDNKDEHYQNRDNQQRERFNRDTQSRVNQQFQNGSRQVQRQVRSGREKTLWVSTIPSRLSDAEIQASISQQLKSKNCEGNAVRIERSVTGVHGYIELDTENAAKILLDSGLVLLDQLISVDIPGQRIRRKFNDQIDGQRGLRQNRREQQNGQTVILDQGDSEEGWTSASRKKPMIRTSNPSNHYYTNQNSNYNHTNNLNRGRQQRQSNQNFTRLRSNDKRQSPPEQRPQNQSDQQRSRQ